MNRAQRRRSSRSNPFRGLSGLDDDVVFIRVQAGDFEDCPCCKAMGIDLGGAS